VIIIKNKKLLLTLSVFFIAFLFTGCFLFNIPPVIESDPVTTAKEGVVYTYDVEATDPNGDTITYSLTTSPTGMTINSTTGVISWTPTEAQIGENEVVVEVSDESKSATQSFTITVDEAWLTSIEVLPPSVEIAAGSSKTITSVTAHYGNGTSANIALSACTYVSNQTKVTVTNGTINVSASCSALTAIITVSYTEGDETKSDTVTVTVPAPASGG
jgi:hypothetical protein